MKRFFKPIEKERSPKKPALSSDCASSNDAKVGSDPMPSDEKEKKKEPRKFLTWNANSFLLRLKSNLSDFSQFLQEVDPDIICIQEVRIPAAGSKHVPKNPCEIKDDTNAAREDKQIVMHALKTEPLNKYKVWWSLADTKYSGTAMLIKKDIEPKKISFNFERTGSKHEQDGRVIIAEFESFIVLNTYSPNNGWKEESFQRRRKWDKRILEFVQCVDKPLIWCGDLNVSHEEIDVTHPEFFSTAKLDGYIPPNEEDIGQPGFTVAERRRFSNILCQGKLVDAYRFLHKEQDLKRGFSWCGNPIGKYRGLKMRLDYFLVAEKLKERIVACEMHGHGIYMEGYYASDHCPVTLELSEEEIEKANL